MFSEPWQGYASVTQHVNKFPVLPDVWAVISSKWKFVHLSWLHFAWYTRYHCLENFLRWLCSSETARRSTTTFPFIPGSWERTLTGSTRYLKVLRVVNIIGKARVWSSLGYLKVCVELYRFHKDFLICWHQAAAPSELSQWPTVRYRTLRTA